MKTVQQDNRRTIRAIVWASVFVLALTGAVARGETPDSAAADFLAAGPVVEFDDRGAATIFWETTQPARCVVEFGQPGRLAPLNEPVGAPPSLQHRHTASKLDPETDYAIRLRLPFDGEERVSETWRILTPWDFGERATRRADSPFPNATNAAALERAAEDVLGRFNARSGHCLVLGADGGQLAFELANRSRLKVIAVMDDEERVRRARRLLAPTGLYGRRLTIHQRAPGPLPYPDGCFNLIVTEPAALTGATPQLPAAELRRLLRPYGGAAWILRPSPYSPTDKRERTAWESWLRDAATAGYSMRRQGDSWSVLERGAPAGAGEWTHQYADPQNTACSNDALRGPLGIQWFGRPGPRGAVDRHHRPVAPLFKAGRLFVPGLDSITALDAYNGARLWTLALPGSLRVALNRNAGHLALAEDRLYAVVGDRCRAVDVATGRVRETFAAPQAVAGQRGDWGYLACAGERLYGSGQKAGASFQRHRRIAEASAVQAFRLRRISGW